MSRQARIIRQQQELRKRRYREEVDALLAAEDERRYQRTLKMLAERDAPDDDPFVRWFDRVARFFTPKGAPHV